MKSSVPLAITHRRATVALLAALATAPLLPAALYVWDPADASNGTTIDAGFGTWSTAADSLVWNNAGTNVPWAQTSATAPLHQAQFGGADAPEGTTYTVTVAEPVAVATPSGTNGLWFSSNGYRLTAASAQTITTSRLTVSTGKVATISGPLAINASGTNALTLGGFGRLNLEDGVRLSSSSPTPNNNLLILNHGSKLTVGTGAEITTTGQIVIGPSGTAANASPTEVVVAGGSFSTTATSTSSVAHIVLGNTVTAPSGGASASFTFTLESGTVSCTSPIGGIRFRNNVGGNALLTSTFNLDGGTLTTARFRFSGRQNSFRPCSPVT